jgi:hypothetical protein
LAQRYPLDAASVACFEGRFAKNAYRQKQSSISKAFSKDQSEKKKSNESE